MTSLEQMVHEIAALSPGDIDAWIECGWLRPIRSGDSYEFSDVDVARCRLIIELRDELAFDEESLPVVLSLLDEVYGLRHRLRLLLGAVERQAPESRQAIAAAIRELLDGKDRKDVD